MERSELICAARQLGRWEDMVKRRERLQTVSFGICALFSIASNLIANGVHSSDENMVMLGFVLIGNIGFMIRNVKLLEKAREEVKLLQGQLGLVEKMKNDDFVSKMSSWTLGDDGELVEQVEDSLYLNNNR